MDQSAESAASTQIAYLLGVPVDQLPPALELTLGEETDLGGWRVEPVAYVSGSPATAALQRVVVRRRRGGERRLFVKLLQHVRHWPMIIALPPAFAAAFAEEFPWRDELRLWDPVVQTSLPDGLRSPELIALVELPEDRVAVWTEDVRQDAGATWDLARFARAAELLGRWNARSSRPEVLALSPFPPGHGLRMYAERSVPARGLAPLADDGLWQHPWLAPYEELRARQQALSGEIPAMLDRLDALPQCLPHGDASPQNLLVPLPGPHESAELVVIDLSFGTPHAVGFDLGQLLVGLVHAEQLPAASMPAIAEVIVPAYARGAAAEGLDLPVETVRTGFVLSALLRSGFDALRLDLLGRPVDDAAAAESFAERVRLEQALTDLALALAPDVT